MNTIKAIIAEDTQIHVLVLKKMIEVYCPDIEVVFTANNMVDTIEYLKNEPVDMLFLDIQYDNHTAFDFMEEIELYHKKVIILVSEYAEFAIKAFKYNITDFIAKPINPAELIFAYNNAKKQIHEYNQAITGSNDNNIIEGEKIIAISSMDKIDILDLNNILYIEASGKYSIFKLTNGKEIIASKSLLHYQSKIKSDFFIRIHHKFVVNFKYIKKYDLDNNAFCKMQDDTIIPISRRNIPIFISNLHKIV